MKNVGVRVTRRDTEDSMGETEAATWSWRHLVIAAAVALFLLLFVLLLASFRYAPVHCDDRGVCFVFDRWTGRLQTLYSSAEPTADL